MLESRAEGMTWVEPFVGGANMIDKVDGERIGADLNKYLISLLKGLQGGYIPRKISKLEYDNIKNNKESYLDMVVGWCGIGCSYSGKWFGGYAGETKTKTGIRDYQKEAINNLLKQSENIKNILFCHCGYNDLEIPPNSLIYCDPPYEGTTKYKDDFNHNEFWDWCREKAKEGHQVFVSEYNAPNDFQCVWEMEVSSSLSANGKSGSNKKSTEKLFKVTK